MLINNEIMFRELYQRMYSPDDPNIDNEKLFKLVSKKNAEFLQRYSFLEKAVEPVDFKF